MKAKPEPGTIKPSKWVFVQRRIKANKQNDKLPKCPQKPSSSV